MGDAFERAAQPVIKIAAEVNDHGSAGRRRRVGARARGQRRVSAERRLRRTKTPGEAHARKFRRHGRQAACALPDAAGCHVAIGGVDVSDLSDHRPGIGRSAGAHDMDRRLVVARCVVGIPGVQPEGSRQHATLRGIPAGQVRDRHGEDVLRARCCRRRRRNVARRPEVGFELGAPDVETRRAIATISLDAVARGRGQNNRRAPRSGRRHRSADAIPAIADGTNNRREPALHRAQHAIRQVEVSG